jgi:D-alanyl-D-alanine carboxypeptidase/D-alanyl-D-alanine-endopeptidase (penicillin-binding protein 4)
MRIRSSFLPITALILVSALLLSGRSFADPPAGASFDPGLTQAIDAALDVPSIKMGFQGIVIQSLRDHSLWYERNGDQVFLPASNNKLLTSAAALLTLGQDYIYHTRLLRIGTLTPSGTLQGDLTLCGAGDALLTPADLEQLARQVKEAGISEVTGGLHYDDSLFDRQWLGDGWTWDDEPYYYSAQVSALDVNENIVELRMTPGHRIGLPVQITVTPPNRIMQIVNRATTAAAKGRSTLDVTRIRGQNTLIVTGTMPIDMPKHDEDMTVENPARFATLLLRTDLERAGVKLDHGEVMDGPTVPRDAEPVAEHLSLPLSEILKKLNKPSDNLVAECLLKTVGAVKTGHGTAGYEGTGAKSAREVFQTMGMDITRIHQVDGSGLSRTNFVSPRNLVRLLDYFHSSPLAQVLYDSLPIAGVDGSLRGRMKGTRAANNCHAKTGYVSNVSCLSGYVTTRDGEMLAFSIMMNNHLAPASACTTAQDKIVALLADYSRYPSASAAQPTSSR